MGKGEVDNACNAEPAVASGVVLVVAIGDVTGKGEDGDKWDWPDPLDRKGDLVCPLHSDQPTVAEVETRLGLGSPCRSRS